MRRTDHLLEIPAAAALLAEAAWRSGDEDSADQATQLALEAAESMGSIHLLLVALERVPEAAVRGSRSEEHTSELQSLMRISYAVFCLKKKTNIQPNNVL